MGFLRGGNSNTQITKYSGLQVQTTSSSLPVPIAYGANVLAPNCFWYQHFQAHPQHAGGKGGGKGGGSGSPTGYSYSCAIMMGLAEGPIAGIGKVWQTSATAVTLATLGLSLFTGSSPQAVWPYLAAAFPSQALSYPGVAYVCDANYDLGVSASVGDNNFEVFGVLHGTGVNGIDADPAQVISDFLTNPQYGVGFPGSAIDAASLFGASGDCSYQTYCWASGLAFSPVLNMQETAASILTRWLQLTNSTAIWSGGRLKIIPYGDMAVTGGPAADQRNFSPNLTPVYDLTDEDFLHVEGEDPVAITRSDAYSAYNQQALEIQARSDAYNAGPIVVFDQAAIERFGLRPGPTIAAHEICDAQVGQTAAQLILQRGLYIRNTFTFKLSMEFCLLDPMDLVTLTDPALGLDKTVVRIVEIEEDSDGALTVAAEEFPQGVATATQYPVQDKSNGAPDASVVPRPVNAPLIVEPPPSLTGNSSQLWVAASGQGGDPSWGGCVVWASLDGNSYAQVASISAPARQGVMTAALGSFQGANPDVVDALAVDLTESGGALFSTSPESAAAGVTLCHVDGEYLSFANANLTGMSSYMLTGLYRGLYGSQATAHPGGASFCLLDSAVVQYDISRLDVGQTIYLKFQGFNIFGAAAEDLSTCVAYTHVVQGAGTVGPVARTLAIGATMEFGLVNQSIAETDDYGNVGGPVMMTIDLGSIAS